MKRSILKFGFTATVLFFAVTASAQQATVTKTAIAENDKAIGSAKSAPATEPGLMIDKPKQLKLTEQPKPIVPGGELKPANTADLKAPGSNKQYVEPKATMAELPVFKTAPAVTQSKPVAVQNTGTVKQ